jgi:fatty acid desaturase
VSENPYQYEETEQRPRRRGVEVFTLVLGLATLLVSGYVLTDGAAWTWLPRFDPRWVLAGGAVLVGVLMLGASMRRK